MDISLFFRAVVDSDNTPVVICDTHHTIVYMNPTAIEKYAKRGGEKLIGKSIFDCHNADSCEKIKKVVSFFGENPNENRVFTFHNKKENKDVYMIALRDSSGNLIGYYEKHELRNPENSVPYDKI